MQIGTLTVIHIICITVVYVTQGLESMHIYWVSDECGTSTFNVSSRVNASIKNDIHYCICVIATDAPCPLPTVRLRWPTPCRSCWSWRWTWREAEPTPSLRWNRKWWAHVPTSLLSSATPTTSVFRVYLRLRSLRNQKRPEGAKCCGAHMLLPVTSGAPVFLDYEALFFYSCIFLKYFFSKNS